MGFSRQEYWSGLPCPPPGDLPDPGVESVAPVAPLLQADPLPLNHWGSPVLLLHMSNFHMFLFVYTQNLSFEKYTLPVFF